MIFVVAVKLVYARCLVRAAVKKLHSVHCEACAAAYVRLRECSEQNRSNPLQVQSVVGVSDVTLSLREQGGFSARRTGL